MLIDVHDEDAAGDVLTLVETLQIEWRGRILTVPEGFESDGASVPRILWSTISPRVDPVTLRGAVAHDYLYRRHPAGWSRREADALFREIIQADGLGRIRAWKAWFGVRLFGRKAWEGASCE